MPTFGQTSTIPTLPPNAITTPQMMQQQVPLLGRLPGNANPAAVPPPANLAQPGMAVMISSKKSRNVSNLKGTLDNAYKKLWNDVLKNLATDDRNKSCPSCWVLGKEYTHRLGSRGCPMEGCLAHDSAYINWRRGIRTIMGICYKCYQPQVQSLVF